MYIYDYKQAAWEPHMHNVKIKDKSKLLNLPIKQA